MKALKKGGLLYFSTNYTKFTIAASHIKAISIKDITKATVPFDFAGKLKRQCFLITK
jgi:23S rRNA (cytosine1962-C5)-methyltransferase